MGDLVLVPMACENLSPQASLLAGWSRAAVLKLRRICPPEHSWHCWLETLHHHAKWAEARHAVKHSPMNQKAQTIKKKVIQFKMSIVPVLKNSRLNTDER